MIKKLRGGADFNSTMVRLKDIDGVAASMGAVYFNSTMVRLKDLLTSRTEQSSPGFQFHYGTIKRYIGQR